MLNNYTILDVINISLYLAVWLTASTVQGYTIGYITGAFGFRHRSLLKQLSLAALLSFGTMPCLYNLLGMVGGIDLILVLNAVLLACFVGIVWRRRARLKRLFRHFPRELAANRVFIASIGFWIVLAMSMLVDVQLGGKLFLSLSMFDNCNKVAFADLISRGEIPPTNPFFFPGRPLPVYYHYFWPLVCAVIRSICFWHADARIAVLSGIIWSGIVYLCCLQFCCAYFRTIKQSARRIANLALPLVAVSNLYVFLTLPVNLVYMQQAHRVFFFTVDKWTVEEITPTVIALLWVPHNIASVAVGFLGSACLLETFRQATRKNELFLIIIAALCFASSLGLGAIPAAGFAAGWFIFGMILLCRKQWRSLVNVVTAGSIGVLASIPYFHEIAGAASHQAALSFAIRKFEVIDLLFPALSQSGHLLHQIAYFIALPLNYFVGFGFVLVIGVMYWIRKPGAGKIGRQAELFLVVTIATSFVLGSCLHESASNSAANDFGWRIMMLPQFILVLWSAQYLASLRAEVGTIKLSAINRFLLVSGVLTSIYGLYLDRTQTYLLDAERMYANREIYQEVEQRVPVSAIVQHDPQPLFFGEDVFSHLYSHRRCVICELASTGVPNCPDPNEYGRVGADISKLFDNPSPADALETCRRYKIDVLLIKDTDKLWSNKSAWIWSFPVLAQNDHACAFLINQNLPISAARAHHDQSLESRLQ